MHVTSAAKAEQLCSLSAGEVDDVGIVDRLGGLLGFAWHCYSPSFFAAARAAFSAHRRRAMARPGRSVGVGSGLLARTAATDRRGPVLLRSHSSRATPPP